MKYDSCYSVYDVFDLLSFLFAYGLSVLNFPWNTVYLLFNFFVNDQQNKNVHINCFKVMNMQCHMSCR